MKKYNFEDKTSSFEHQVNAITKISGDHPVALFDEQGLGKSKMVLSGLLNDFKENLIDSILIVCKKTLIKMWEHEINIHTHLKAINLSGKGNERLRKITSFSHFYIINYETLIKDEELLKGLLQLKRFAIVLDESHKIKDPLSKITKSLIRLREYSKKNIIITGTPVANKPEDLWTQFYFLDKGKLLKKDFKEFKKEYGIDIGMGKNKINHEKLIELQKIIINFSIRRTKKVASPDLLDKEYIEKLIELKGKQKELYNSVKDEMYLEFKNIDGESMKDQTENILKKLLRLTQIASNPLSIENLTTNDYDEVPAKFEEMDKIIKKIIKNNEKVIIWTTFVKNILLLKRRYKKYNALTIFGKMTIDERNKVVNWFQNDKDYKVLIANPAAAKEGLTLTSANNAIYLDRNFNITDYLQSQDRIHRLSQTKKCRIILLIAKDTIDEYTGELLMKKQEIARLIQGDSKRLKYNKKLLTKDRLLEILGN
tara:strand:+ start:1509 stop:2957 length:1449 start_codon:yes stop_codon:yes gene_type:complete